MKALLVRVAVDQAYGGWNAPVDPASGQFVYVPIPEKAGTAFHPGCERPYAEVLPALEGFCQARGKDLAVDLRFPAALRSRAMHLDPDFNVLTYGDEGGRRGAGMVGMQAEDLLVFYAGLRPCGPCEHRLLYAIVGLYVVERVLRASEVPEHQWNQNAHTRKVKHGSTDIVVRARPGVSGRLQACIPIGEWRDGSYRVRRDLLTAWGGLSVRDGFIQRSAVPPAFLGPPRFHKWFKDQKPLFLQQNNPASTDDKVFLVHLRRPTLSDPSESRADPFWELGSFGCTGCHHTNLFHPCNAELLAGARLGFVQGGPKGSRLVFLTPPVKVRVWADCCEALWKPVSMPFRYECAPVLAWNDGPGDFPLIEKLARSAACDTIEAGLASRFRARATPLEPALAAEIIGAYERRRAVAAPADKGHVNNVEFVRWMQEAAVRHANAIGCTAATREAGCTWMARSHHIEYLRPALAGDRIRVTTWVADFRRAFSLRKYRFVRASDGTVLARGETDWVFVDTTSGRPKSVPPHIVGMFEVVTEEPKA